MNNFSYFNDQLTIELRKYHIIADRISRLGDGSSNSTYKIETTDGDFVLKLFNFCRYDEIQNEIRLLKELSQYYKSIILPINNKPLLIADKIAYLYKFFNGIIFSEASTKDKYYEFGKIVGQLDVSLQKIGIDKIVNSYDELLKIPNNKYLDCPLDCLTEGAINLYNKEIKNFNFDKIRIQYIHKDLHFYNVIYNKNNKTHLIIDTNSISIQFLPREIAVVIGNEFQNFFNFFSTSKIKMIMNGYETEIKISNLERKVIPLFIIQKKLGEINYLYDQSKLTILNRRDIKVIKKYIFQSKIALKYVLDNYNNLVKFFGKIY